MQESNKNTKQPTETKFPQPVSRLRKRLILGAAIVCIPVFVTMIYLGGDKPVVQADDPPSTKVLKDENPDSKLQDKKVIVQTEEEKFDTECCKKSVGIWEREEEGKRTLTIKEDGTATLVYLPSGLNRWLLGEKVTVKIKWDIQNGKVKFQSLSGIPEKSFDIITLKHGRKRIRKILEVSDENFTLYDEQDKEKSKWTRVSKKG